MKQAMNVYKCWATVLVAILTVLVAILLYPVVAVSARGAAEAYQKGLSYLDRKDYNAAIAAFTEAIQLAPESANTYFNRGSAYVERGEYDRAIVDYTEVIRLRPKDAEAYYARGRGYYQKQDFNRAISDYTEAIRLKPTFSSRSIPLWPRTGLGAQEGGAL